MAADFSSPQTAEAPPEWVHPSELRREIWRGLQQPDSLIEGVYRDLSALLSRNYVGGIRLLPPLPPQGYRSSAILQRCLALGALNVRDGLVTLHTKRCLSRWTDSEYVEAVREFAAECFSIPRDTETYRIKEMLSRRWDVKLPAHLRDDNPLALPPFELAEQLGMHFSPSTSEDEVAAFLHSLDGVRCQFEINSDWIIAKAQQSWQRRMPQEPDKHRHRHKLSGKIDHYHHGVANKPSAARKTAGSDNPHSGDDPGAFRRYCVNRLVAAVEEGKSSSEGLSAYLWDHVLPDAKRLFPKAADPELRAAQRWAKTARNKLANNAENRERQK
jgi:hypothetical protein